MARKNEILNYQHSRGTTRVNRVKELSQFTEKTYIVCDEFFKASISADYYVIAKEENKSLDLVSKVCTHMLETGVARDWTLVTIGGGLIGDLGGYIAATYMRGVKWINIPTTLLAQVDSCIGGKVGVNLLEGKNLLGSIYQPSEVIINHSFLKTLSKRQVKSGWGEIIKYSVIESDFLLELSVDQIPTEQIIDSCLRIKSSFIENDEFDVRGKRILLNYGHTLGHAIEKVSHHEVAHGEAVIWGILFEKFLSEKKLSHIHQQYEPMSHKLVIELSSDDLIKYLKVDKKGALSFFNHEFDLIQLSESEFTDAWKQFTSILKLC